MGNCFGDDEEEPTLEVKDYEQRKEELKTQYKVLMVGDSSVGKSSLLLRFVDDEFTDSTMPTLGIDFKLSHLEVAGQKVQLQIVCLLFLLFSLPLFSFFPLLLSGVSFV